MAHSDSARGAALAAVESIGLGYDITQDLRLKLCKNGSDGPRLVVVDESRVLDIAIPGGISIPNVPEAIKCDKGERVRFSSDVLSFQQMSEQFNQELSLSGKIPSGHFIYSFGFSGCWQKDAACTKSLAFDGVFVTCYNVALEKTQIVLHDQVKQAVPPAWDPVALARFIEKFGTHLVVGVKMGGKDVIYVKQKHSSPLQPATAQKRLKDMADKRFMDAFEQHDIQAGKGCAMDKFDTRAPPKLAFVDPGTSNSYSPKEDIEFLCKRRGGVPSRVSSPHNEWCQTVQSDPDVISMSFVPITSLLNGIDGSGFLSHAINLYLRYKPPIEELHLFLEFQLPRLWAPVFGELPLGPQRKQHASASLQFKFMGPRLFVNTSLVDVGKRPVTGMRLYLEGRRSNCLAIHLQHLSALPKVFQLEDDLPSSCPHRDYGRGYYEKVQWKNFSHVCTAPIESDDELLIVTGARLEVEPGFKKILFLQLSFSKVLGAVRVKSPEWEDSPGMVQKSGLLSTLISTRFTTTIAPKPPPQPSEVSVNSAVYPGGPRQPVQPPKLLRFVDTTEMSRGPEDTPGYWVVSGARLVVERAKICLRVKYSLLTARFPDEEGGDD